MEYRLWDADRELIRKASRDVFLGLILASGELKIRVADSVLYPGHMDWVRRDQISSTEIAGGFSFIVRDGAVTGFFPSSELNRTADWKLPEVVCQEILGILPLSPEWKVY